MAKKPSKPRPTPRRSQARPRSASAGFLGLGIDVIEVDRIEAMIAEHPTRFVSRVFTPVESAHSRGRRNRAQHLAARFAAKEAAMKALGTGLASGVTWHDFEVATDASGKPSLHVTGTAAKIARNLGIRRWHVSLTHTRMHAAAVVVATP